MREDLTPDYFCNLAMMTWSGGALPVIVEGDSDSRLLRPHICRRSAVFVNVQGRPRLIQVVLRLSKAGFTNFCAIMDSDCDRFVDTPVLAGIDNVVVSDEPDIEIVMIETAALGRVLDELASQDKIAGFGLSGVDEVRRHLYQVAGEVGSYRIWARQRHLPVNFDGLSFRDFVDQKTLSVNRTKLVELLVARSKLDSGQRRILREIDSGAMGKGAQICNGHDVLEVLSIALRSAWGSRDAKDVSAERLVSSLRLAFDSACWARSSIGRALIAWARKSGHLCCVSGFAADSA